MKTDMTFQEHTLTHGVATVMGRVKLLSPTEISVLDVLIRRADADGRFFILAELREEIAKAAGTTPTMVNHALSALKSADLIVNRGKGSYQLGASVPTGAALSDVTSFDVVVHCTTA